MEKKNRTVPFVFRGRTTFEGRRHECRLVSENVNTLEEAMIKDKILKKSVK